MHLSIGQHRRPLLLFQAAPRPRAMLEFVFKEKQGLFVVMSKYDGKDTLRTPNPAFYGVKLQLYAFACRLIARKLPELLIKMINLLYGKSLCALTHPPRNCPVPYNQGQDKNKKIKFLFMLHVLVLTSFAAGDLAG